jgi:hypothetical protein
MGQKFSDGARTKLASGITASSTSLTLLDGSAFPAANAGTSAVSEANDWFKVVIQDSDSFEIVYVRSHDTANSPNTFSNVLRGQDGTTAQVFGTDATVGLRPTAGDAAWWNIPLGGTADDYLVGGKTWGNFPAKARATTLTGFSTASGDDVTASDSILAAIGKLAKKIIDHFGVGGGTHPLATTTVHGYFAAAEKVKLSNIAENAAALGTATPSALGTANAGASAAGAHEDHVHPMPTAAQVGATPAAHASATNNPHGVTAAQVGAIPTSQKGAASGVATLDGSGKVPEGQLPAIAITDVFSVASQVAMLALTAQRGDIAIRTDLNRSFALAAEPASTLGNWLELRTPTDAVLSVAGQTGVVTLTPGDVGAAPAAHASATNNPHGVTAAQVGAEPSIAAGTATQYWRGDKSWQDVAAAVRGSVLTGLSTATRRVVAAADSVLIAIGLLEASKVNREDSYSTVTSGSINLAAATELYHASVSANVTLTPTNIPSSTRRVVRLALQYTSGVVTFNATYFALPASMPTFAAGKTYLFSLEQSPGNANKFFVVPAGEYTTP